jgi:diguanylate cyclase (GGDEF)-like protein
MDPLTLSLAAGAAAVAGLGAGLRARYRARHAEAEAEALRRELRDERHAASHDALTDLPNRQTFNRLGAALLADRTQPPLVGIVIDLDNLRLINDTLGRAAGDEVLGAMGRRLAAYAGENLVGRLGGDEFAALLSSADSDWCWPYPAGAWLAEALARPIRVAGRTVIVSATVGVAPVHGFVHLPEILRRAERALYRAKSTNRRTACYDPLMDDDGLRPSNAPSLPRPRQREIETEHIPNSGHWLDEQPRTPPGGCQLVGVAAPTGPAPDAVRPSTPPRPVA